MTNQPDEETPLLPQQQTKKKPTPLPWFQLSILLCLHLAAPFTSQVIYPFVPELIRSLGITNGEEKKVGYYVGMMQSIFFITQALTMLHWSRISDRVGRKPVILAGLAGVSISMYLFGLSRTFWGLVVSRSLSGALNGNLSVIKSMMTELTDSTNIAKAYTYIPIASSTGATLGPIIGGSLSRPAERFPKLFGHNEFLKKYPYFLPCAVPATYTVVAWLVTFVFLKETVKHPVPVLQYFGLRKDENDRKAQAAEGIEEPGQSGTQTTQRRDIPDDEKPLPLRSLLTRKVILAAGNYASLSLIDIAYRAIQPVFFSTPIEDGGLGLSPLQIGKIMSTYGILNGIFQICFFARIHDWWGSKKTFIVGVAATLPVFAAFPVINYLARVDGYGLSVWMVVGLQVVLSILISMSYGAVFIFIAGASPNRASLGATNGLSQTTVSIMRAIGPATANSLFSLSIDKGYMGGNLVYYVLMSTVIASLYFASLLPSNVWE
ncbi:hypothetical protein AMATHDRAFT_149810 [Amanita thiersii Skay4041]|uniref:Major facilitator superfamily (MFS) profile domain-containing protein n=1 Tax=Amanita thiersii Skay4041 TaxID=703135 RepID=A0A2A9NGN9_9AGAR|nr:hypothetical protein AMATHDRAFT_149810 [Amanita thiersii Skay4041]